MENFVKSYARLSRLSPMLFTALLYPLFLFSVNLNEQLYLTNKPNEFAKKS